MNVPCDPRQEGVISWEPYKAGRNRAEKTSRLGAGKKRKMCSRKKPIEIRLICHSRFNRVLLKNQERRL